MQHLIKLEIKNEKLETENERLKKQWTDVPDEYENWKEVAEYFMDLDTTKCDEFEKIMDERDATLAENERLKKRVEELENKEKQRLELKHKKMWRGRR